MLKLPAISCGFVFPYSEEFYNLELNVYTGIYNTLSANYAALFVDQMEETKMLKDSKHQNK